MSENRNGRSVTVGRQGNAPGWYKRLVPRNLREILSPLISSICTPVYFYSTTESCERTASCVAYIGPKEDRARLWAKRMIGQSFIKSGQGRSWIFSHEAYIANSHPDVELVMVEINWLSRLLPFQSRSYKLPMWIQFNLDTSRPFGEIEAATNRLHHEIPRLIRKHGMDLEISNSRADLAYFMETMHKPYIAGRHGETAFFSSDHEIDKIFSDSELMFVRRGGERISGVLLRFNKDYAALHYIGVKNNDAVLMREGAVSALYYFAIRRTIEKGVPSLNLGGTCPFLNDGVAYFKLSLKPYATRTTYLRDFFISFRVRRITANVAEMLINSPFINVCGNQSLELIFHLDTARSSGLSELIALEKKTRCSNVNRIIIFRKSDLVADDEIKAVFRIRNIPVLVKPWAGEQRA